jgi:hypothetical protein
MKYAEATIALTLFGGLHDKGEVGITGSIPSVPSKTSWYLV